MTAPNLLSVDTYHLNFVEEYFIVLLSLFFKNNRILNITWHWFWYGAVVVSRILLKVIWPCALGQNIILAEARGARGRHFIFKVYQILIKCAALFLLTWQKLKSSGKKKLQLRNCFQQISLWACLWDLFLAAHWLKGPSLLWVVAGRY